MSRSEAVVEHLEASIRQRQLKAGHRLGTKEELLREYSVAGATLNEALRLLQMRGVLTVRPGRGGGVYVAERSPFVWLGHSLLRTRGDGRTHTDLIAIRDALDPLVAAEAALHRTEHDIAELRMLLDEMDAATNPTAALRANWQLHRRIGEITPNAPLRSLYTGLLDVLAERLEAVSPPPEFTVNTGERRQVHHDIVAAIAAADAEAAAEAAIRHKALTRQQPT